MIIETLHETGRVALVKTPSNGRLYVINSEDLAVIANGADMGVIAAYVEIVNDPKFQHQLKGGAP